MKLNLKHLVDAIRSCEGGVVNVIKDSDPINDILLNSITNELCNYYTVIKLISFSEYETIDVNDIDEKTVIIIPYNKTLNFSKMFQKSNITYLIIRDNYTTNTTLKLEMQSNYLSSFIILLKNKYLKIIRSRTISRFTDNVDSIVDINSLLRKIKLQTLKQKQTINKK